MHSGGNQGEEVIVFDMKQMEQKQRMQSQVVGPNYQRRKKSFKADSRKQSQDEVQEIEMSNIGKSNSKQNYKKQGLGGYDDEEESLDNSGRIDV